MIEGVSDILRRVAADAILPRFRRLQSGDISEKSPGEIVTAADRQAEDLLTAALLALSPGSKVVGEEAASARPKIVEWLESEEQVWLVDPLDGTANFVEGIPCFSMMVALVMRGQAIAAWMLDPLTDEMAVAQKGSGAWLGSARVRTSTAVSDLRDMRGAIFKRFLPPSVRTSIETRETSIGSVLPGLKCAGKEYPLIATGGEDFALFWRTEPWDHAPGVLFLEEAGGHAARLDGSPYRLADRRAGLLAAQNAEIWHAIHRHLAITTD